ncbi:TylF/MycF/NovP-related O-methyltransferase [Lichenicoccus roseus]|uniref:Macrocin-O-methyltransferase n=1 Tax=Lichenicoccus roseus TaxID=2683649 RepID=A0A5R9JBX2_9PROT|nr:TylF/MycF/NovP-related O-methyltransferase [Lichenicoccus roseus]TLU74253.1 macrocin-O-methyltransferase [Lichenicoccus roseus]
MLPIFRKPSNRPAATRAPDGMASAIPTQPGHGNQASAPRPPRKLAGLVPQATMHRLFARSRLLRRVTVGTLSRVELVIMGGHKQRSRLDIIRRVRSERESLLSGNEAFMITSLAAAQRAVGGVMAEVGVFQGCSAKLISVAGRPEQLHLFDTFAGLPEPDRDERRAMRKGHYAASLEAVRSYLSDQPNIVFHKGLFTGANVSCSGERFSFVHLDVDLKEGTRACLEFFYPRMLPGGVILSHDYSYLDGVREAFQEYLADRPERVIELPSSQVMLIKT